MKKTRQNRMALHLITEARIPIDQHNGIYSMLNRLII